MFDLRHCWSALCLAAMACAAHGGTPAVENVPQTAPPPASSSAPPTTHETQAEPAGNRNEHETCPDNPEDLDHVPDGCPDID